MGISVLTVEETAALLKTSKQQVRKMIREDILPAVKVGRRRLQQERPRVHPGLRKRA